MLYAYVRIFDMMGTVEFFLETKQGLNEASSLYGWFDQFIKYKYIYF